MTAASFSTLRRAVPLSFVLFRAGLVAQNRRSLLGYVWLFLPVTVAVLTAGYVRSRGLINYPVGALPYPVFVFAGTVLWQVFVDALVNPLAQLTASRAMFTRLDFPHEGIILAGLWQALVNAAVRLAALLGLCIALHVSLTWNALDILPGVACLALLGLGVGILIAPLGLLYDDVGKGIILLTGLLFFFMPIAYPLSGDGWQAINPVLSVINSARDSLTSAVGLQAMLAPVCLAVGMLTLGWPLYRVAQPHVLERLG